MSMAHFGVCWFGCFLVEVKSRSLGVGPFYYGCVYHKCGLSNKRALIGWWWLCTRVRVAEPICG